MPISRSLADAKEYDSSLFHFALSLLAMEPSYKYEPSDSKRLLRIIRLKPATDFRAALHREVLVIDLSRNERPEYEAISYTWEGQKPSPDHFILCHSEDGRIGRLWIAEKSEAAIQRMRLEHGWIRSAPVRSG
jgi:hypothetical protein